jgi:hypothetical protein
MAAMPMRAAAGCIRRAMQDRYLGWHGVGHGGQGLQLANVNG